MRVIDLLTRPIKFRAWDGSHIQYFDFSVGGLYEMEGHWVRNPDLVWMQFTGLFDKHGKEIYEGDIVNAHGFYSRGVVRYGEYCREQFTKHDRQVSHLGFYVELIPYPDGYGEVRNTGFKSLTGEHFEWEVLGNVHECPDCRETC